MIGVVKWASCFVVALSSMQTVCAQQVPSVPSARHIPLEEKVVVHESGSTEVDELVRGLVSNKPAPFPDGYHGPAMYTAFPLAHCTPEVAAAKEKLKAMGPKIYPALIKHIYDDRYSYSAVYAAWRNHDVGDAIISVLSDGHNMHSGYKARSAPGGRGGGYFSFEQYLDAKGIEQWAERASQLTKLQIQLEFIDWCIEEENRRGYVDDAQRKSVLEQYEQARRRVTVEAGSTANHPQSESSAPPQIRLTPVPERSSGSK